MSRSYRIFSPYLGLPPDLAVLFFKFTGIYFRSSIKYSLNSITMKKVFSLLLSMLIILPMSAQVNKKFGKVIATKKVITPIVKGYSDTIIGQQYSNCQISGQAVKVIDQEIQNDLNIGDLFMIKDAACKDIAYKVAMINEIMGSTFIDFVPLPPLDLSTGFTIAELVYTPELKLKNVKHLKADTNTIRSHLAVKCGTSSPLIESFSSGEISGWVLYNERGDKCYIYPNSTGDGIAVTTTKP